MWLLSPEIVLILFTRGLLCVQCAKNCTTCEYYTANYRIFLEHQLNSKRFPRAISNSRRFQGLPGVVDILLLLQKFVTVRCAPSAAAAFTQVRRAETSVLFSAVRDIITRSTQMYSTTMLPLKQHAKPPNWWASLRNQNA